MNAHGMHPLPARTVAVVFVQLEEYAILLWRAPITSDGAGYPYDPLVSVDGRL